MEGKPQIERVNGVFYVVVPQRTGAPLKFECDTERDALHFLEVFSKPVKGRPAS